MPEDREMAEVVSLGEENGGEASEKIVEKIQNRMEMLKWMEFWDEEIFNLLFLYFLECILDFV